MKIGLFVIAALLISCANSNTNVEHTVVVKGDQSSSLAAGDSPSTLSITVEELYAGEAADCSDLKLIRVLSGGSGEATEILLNSEPIVISARPEDMENVRCVAVRMSDIITFTPNDQAVSNIGDCNNQAYETDIFTGGTNNDINGDPTTGSNSKQSIFLFYSISVPSTPTDASQRFTMPAAINLDAPRDILLYAEFEDDVVPGGGTCTLSGGISGNIGMRAGSN